MSDQIKHECGIAMLRLLKPLEYYNKKYGTPFFAMNKLYLLMEKQHNRGQDGAGIANIKLDVEQGSRYISRYRSNGQMPIQEIFEYLKDKFEDAGREFGDCSKDPIWLKNHYGFSGELWMGHLRYGTFGKNTIESCHPFLRQNNWMTRNLVLAGNFNLTNVDELFDLLVNLGQHPKEKSDTVTVLEKIGHFLDEENELLYRKYRREGHSKKDISHMIAANLNIKRILKRSVVDWDGGYAILGLFGHGDAFALRDPHGIRPVYYYHDDEIAVVASERPPIQTSFNVPLEKIRELTPGAAFVIRRSGQVCEEQITRKALKRSCSFERIYFSRGNDADIYEERKRLGSTLCKQVLKAIDKDLINSVFSYIPNTAETAFYGLIKGLENRMKEIKKRKIKKLGPKPSENKLNEILNMKPRVEKVALKDIKLRTFITQDADRDDLVAHVYDITYGTIREGKDNLIVLDDSIVRGTTLKESIIRILDRLHPRKIIIVSSAPQIRYPDCYGIDMAKLGDLIAFKATVKLLEETGEEHILTEAYKKAKRCEGKQEFKLHNYVRDIYSPFSTEQISGKIASMLKADDIHTELQVIYQTIEGLHKAIPNHKGDWYFTGKYPTPGGNKVANRSLINFVEKIDQRAY